MKKEECRMKKRRREDLSPDFFFILHSSFLILHLNDH